MGECKMQNGVMQNADCKWGNGKMGGQPHKAMPVLMLNTPSKAPQLT